MNVTRKHLEDAVAQDIISAEQARLLSAFFEQQAQQSPRFTLTYVLYYLGGLIAIGAMTLFMTIAWEAFGGAGIFWISLLYAGLGLKLANRFARQQLTVPSGIMATFVVCLTPLAVYGLQQWMGVWPDDSTYRDYHRYVQWHWLYMELATLAVGCVLAWRYRYPFMIMPIAVTLWYMTMDLTAVISAGDFDWALRKLVSMVSGLLMIGLAFWVDVRSRRDIDYAFWIYLFGAIAFWGGLSAMDSDDQWSKLAYCGINLLMIVLGVILLRRVFVVLGALGVCGYLGYLSFDVFKDSLLFPFVLTAIGIGVIYFGILWQRHERALTVRLRAYLPHPLRELLESIAV